MNSRLKYLLILLAMAMISHLSGQNPIIRNQFSADPTARVFGDTVYLFPSHDIANMGKGRKDWFCMADYHTFSSSDLTNWTDHGVIVSQEKVAWVDSTGYNMWAPDCIEKNGKYYFYFPAGVRDSHFGRGFGIGVAIADNPSGPYIPQPAPIKNVHGIDPNILIDKDGQAYIYWAARNIYVAKLKDNMLELASEPVIIANLPDKGLKEGPFVFERNGIYYLTYPHVRNKTECLEYAISNNPMGPYKVTGVIMDESPTGCWTNHQSVINFRGQWYLFYHHNDFSPQFDKNRSVRIDSLFFNENGTIKKVIPTLRGVGVTLASEEIQLDRYSARSDTSVRISFNNSENAFEGWKTTFEKSGSWIQYNSVDFDNSGYNKVQIKTVSVTGSKLQIRLDKTDGPLLAELTISENASWNVPDFDISDINSGIHNLVIIHKDDRPLSIDWIRFIK